MNFRTWDIDPVKCWVFLYFHFAFWVLYAFDEDCRSFKIPSCFYCIILMAISFFSVFQLMSLSLSLTVSETMISLLHFILHLPSHVLLCVTCGLSDSSNAINGVFISFLIFLIFFSWLLPNLLDLELTPDPKGSSFLKTFSFHSLTNLLNDWVIWIFGTPLKWLRKLIRDKINIGHIAFLSIF